MAHNKRTMGNYIQKSLFSVSYSPPAMEQYDKFYTIYAFDEILYHKKLKEYFKEHNRRGVYDLTYEERKKIRRECYVRDDDGELQHLGDMRHVFRIPALQSIYEKIYLKLFNITNIPPGIALYEDETQAELVFTQNYEIKERLQSHIYFLKLLRENIPHETALLQVKARFLED